jgi:endonuclease/exonuclease/phosphatase family metal-dependent hydrolase
MHARKILLTARILGVLLILLLLLLLIVISRRQIGDYSNPENPIFAGSFASEPGQFDGTLRVVSWNVHYAEFVEQIIATLENAEELRDADVMLFQEVSIEGVETIARRMGYNYVFYPAVFSRRRQEEYGNAILSKWSLRDPGKIVLPNAIPGWIETRNASRATITLVDDDILVYSVHLDTTWIIPKWVRSQGLFLVDVIASDDKFVILGGDFNTWTQGGIATLENGLGRVGLIRLTRGTGYTFETSSLKLTLDHIFSGEVLDYQAGVYRDTDASDHYPVWADMVMSDAD